LADRTVNERASGLAQIGVLVSLLLAPQLLETRWLATSGPACAWRTEPPSIDVEMALRAAGATVDLEQLALTDQVADRNRLEPERRARMR